MNQEILRKPKDSNLYICITNYSKQIQIDQILAHLTLLQLQLDQFTYSFTSQSKFHKNNNKLVLYFRNFLRKYKQDGTN